MPRRQRRSLLRIRSAFQIHAKKLSDSLRTASALKILVEYLSFGNRSTMLNGLP
jgi:hypothetical protein